MAELPVFTAERLGRLQGVRHAFFSRRGGVSVGLYSSLNVGLPRRGASSGGRHETTVTTA